MTAEEAIIDAKDKQPRTKEEPRRSRTVAVVLTGFLVIALVAVVYAFVQQVEAKRQAEIANQIMKKNMELQQELKIVREDADRQRIIAEAERAKAVKILEDCKSSQKKK